MTEHCVDKNIFDNFSPLMAVVAPSFILRRKWTEHSSKSDFFHDIQVCDDEGES